MGWPQSIGVGVEFTPCSATALRQAVRLAERIGASRHVETMVVMDQVTMDTPLTAMLGRVRERSADLLVLGTHGTSPADRGAGTHSRRRARSPRRSRAMPTCAEDEGRAASAGRAALEAGSVV